MKVINRKKHNKPFKYTDITAGMFVMRREQESVEEGLIIKFASRLVWGNFEELEKEKYFLSDISDGMLIPLKASNAEQVSQRFNERGYRRLTYNEEKVVLKYLKYALLLGK